MRPLYNQHILLIMITSLLACQASIRETFKEKYVHFNDSLSLECPFVINVTTTISWTKDGINFVPGKGRISFAGKSHERLEFKRLVWNDKGDYNCTTGSGQDRRTNVFYLRVITKPKVHVPEVSRPGVTNSKTPNVYYSVPDWLTAVACVILISMVAVIVVVVYVKIRKPKRAPFNKGFPAPTDVVDFVEVVTHGLKPPIEMQRFPGGVRQRKSTSSVSSFDESNELHSRPKFCSTRKYHDEDLGIGETMLTSLKTSPLLPSTTKSRQVTQLQTERNSKTDGRALREVKSEPCNVLNSEEKMDFASFMLHYAQSMSKEASIVNRVRSEPELLEKMSVDYRRKDHASSKPEMRPRKSRNEVDYHRSNPKLIGKTPEDTRNKECIPGKALRKVTSEPYCIPERPISKKNTSETEGQALRKVHSEPTCRSDTVYHGPVIKAGLGYDKNELYAKTMKLKKSKSDKPINTRTPLEGEVAPKKITPKRTRKVKEEVLQFPNQIYGSIEEITSHISQQDTATSIDENEPIYQDINNYVHPAYRHKNNHEPNNNNKRVNYIDENKGDESLYEQIVLPNNNEINGKEKRRSNRECESLYENVMTCNDKDRVTENDTKKIKAAKKVDKRCEKTGSEDNAKRTIEKGSEVIHKERKQPRNDKRNDKERQIVLEFKTEKFNEVKIKDDKMYRIARLEIRENCPSNATKNHDSNNDNEFQHISDSSPNETHCKRKDKKFTNPSRQRIKGSNDVISSKDKLKNMRKEKKFKSPAHQNIDAQNDSLASSTDERENERKKEKKFKSPARQLDMGNDSISLSKQEDMNRRHDRKEKTSNNPAKQLDWGDYNLPQDNKRERKKQVNEKDVTRERRTGASPARRAKKTKPQQEKKYENLAFSFSEGLDDFGGCFDEETNNVIDRMYDNVIGVGHQYTPSRYGDNDRIYDNVGQRYVPKIDHVVQQVPRLPDNIDADESLYEEVYCSKA